MITRSEPFPSRLYRVCVLFTAMFACILLGGCGGGNSGGNVHGDGTSGVRGTAMLVGTDATTQTPLPNALITVQRTNPQGAGQYAPLSYGPVLTQTQTDAQGNYSIALAPGVYGIGGQVAQPNNYRGVTNSIAISRGQYTQLNVTFTSSAQ